MDIARENLSGKVVLEVGSGRGDATRELVNLLSQYPDTTLVVTDISDQHFDQLRQEFVNKPVRVRFVQTNARTLDGVENDSIDYIVCDYTLCAINALNGLAVLALRRFWEVLKPTGCLFIEEEFPTSKMDTPTQIVWAEKWRILKAATILTNGFPFTEFQPEILADMCRLFLLT